MTVMREGYFNILTFNARGITKKLKVLQKITRKLNIQAVLLQEHHKKLLQEIALEGFQTNQLNRANEWGGASLSLNDNLRLNEDILGWRTLQHQCEDLELLLQEIQFKNLKKPLLLGSLYLPPTVETYSTKLNEVKKNLRKIQ